MRSLRSPRRRPPHLAQRSRRRPISTIFGPFYSSAPSFQAALDHAERAHAVLGLLIEEQDAARKAIGEHELSHAEQWLSGRDSELLVFVGFHVEDWGEGRISDGEATTAIESYLRDRIHEGLRSEFGREPACCLAQESAQTMSYLVESSTTCPVTHIAISPAAESLPASDEAIPPSSSPSWASACTAVKSRG